MSTQPRCYCGHKELAHQLDEIAPQCSADGCICQQYRAAQPPKPRPMTAHTPLPDDAKKRADDLQSRPSDASRVAPVEAAIIAVEVLLAEAKQRTPRIRRLAEHIEASLANLRDLVAADNDAAAARAEIAQLEEQLRKAKAKLAGKKPAKKPADRIVVAAGEPAYPCDDCHRIFGKPHALNMHRVRMHGYRKAEAS